ncbi:hypothetical protein INT08_04885 [Prosthecochloris sp. N3]|uniref:Lipoprotein n=1 Tax=Prosthecochloris ethylica TaxID=2743976 RepID=A0ABR9XR97_9CHLB|nr:MULTISPECIES: hypothetical protein [Prosthecochloris]MBF0586085.1 hypothetical protein [Prosthecochloris ethylica]MBF0636515.1 hypothetical protein [Prosthecochloris ethylica]NUK47147.1 hypothetical protein [Prosthecochloris ethylica]RNA65691.1 hypothetical protein CR163_011005 [Prosthecochloris sp. ZM_2]
MKTIIHKGAGVTAFCIISLFWLSTIFVELFGSHEAVAFVKRSIVLGMWIVIPAIITTGITGTILGKKRNGKFVERKKRRMPFIALNGLLILVPSAIFLDHCASNGNFGSFFYAVQGLELAAGALNIVLIGSSIRDGLQLSTSFGQAE